ncbi:MAG: D-alanine--D-alanine ligase [Anaerolineae bacterium]|nr:D-alanine--D-alanine ligase [Anaerolineae bacterium]
MIYDLIIHASRITYREVFVSSSEKRRKLRVGVLFGGQSGEHEVSLTSAKGIMEAMDKKKYEVVPIGITKSGQWLTGGDIHQQLLDAAAGHPVIEAGAKAESGQTTPVENALALPISATGPLDVIFPVLHGPFGEDGTVQGFLELVGIPYVGAGVLGSAAGMDKAVCKDIFRAHGLPIVIHRTFLRKQWQQDPQAVIDECEAAIPYPMFVKPANLGSSVGIHKARNREDLWIGLEDAARYDRKLIVEQGLDAREIEVSVLGNDDPIASLPGEIIPSREFYSYAAKYIDGTSELLIPAPLSQEHTELVQQLAIMSFKALDCAGLARCDMLLEKATGEVFINEINTMPGFTPISMYPKLWAASGLSYSELIDRLIELALERHADKQQSQTTFDVRQAE